MSLHVFLSIVLVGIGLYVVLILTGVESWADNIPSQTTIANVAPTVVDVFVANAQWNFSDANSLPVTVTTITPTAGGTTSFWLTGSVHEPNGVDDIDHVTGSFYRSGTGLPCTDDNNDCYNYNACDLRDDTRIDVGSYEYRDYSCPISVAYWIDSTSTGGNYADENWGVNVYVEDLSGSGSSKSTSREVATVLDLNIPASINYGTRTAGEKSTVGNNVEMVFTQRANDKADVNVQGATTMMCDNLGSIPDGNQEWALTDVAHSDIASTDLTNSAVDTELEVNYRLSESLEETKTLYWNIEIPSVNISGVCSGVSIITEVAT